jgi:hypothetical protein
MRQHFGLPEPHDDRQTLMDPKGIIHPVATPKEVEALFQSLSSAKQGPCISRVIDLFEDWGKLLDDPSLGDIPGLAFLKLWLRRGTIEGILKREFGQGAELDSWFNIGRSRFKAFPVGVVGHWPAGNIEIQPVLSLACSLLGGNKGLVRVPSRCIKATSCIVEKLFQADKGGLLEGRIAFMSFDHGLRPLHEAMAHNVDGAMIWGGDQAVLESRSLPFPHWARLAVFGPRISVAIMDKGAWSSPESRKAWCQRLARDVWQFEQQACSSPQTLFVEGDSGTDMKVLIQSLVKAFEDENRAHPRTAIDPGLTSSILRRRADWLMGDAKHKASFPNSPDWTILYGKGVDIPNPVQGKTLFVLETDNLSAAVERLDGNVQTLGLGMTDRDQEAAIAEQAAGRGVDRVVKLGQMHTFASPWDGRDLIRPMVRIVQHIPAAEAV